MNATLKNESPAVDTYTEKNPRFVPEGRWRMPCPSGTGFFTKNIGFEALSVILLAAIIMTTKKFSVKRGSHGLGLFTNIALKKDDLVIEYTGEKISTAVADSRGGQYLFELNDKWTIDGRGRENEARYINHSCSPNCYPEIDEGEKHIFIYAKKAIKPGEELTYNYGKEFWKTYINPKQCRCPKCLGANKKS